MATFSNRHQIQEHLASLTTEGVIVELGCGYGNGVIALAKGNINKLPVYSIDPYLPYTDPLGGSYGIDTYRQMIENTKGVAFVHLMQPALVAIRDWHKPIGLLWVDLSMPYDDLWLIVHAWEKWLISGGHLAITGLEYGQLGTCKIYEELQGYDKVLTEQGLVAVLRKK